MDADINRHQLAAVGITNQRETAVVWDKNTGEPVYNAIVWQDTRTQKICNELAGDEGADKYKERVGLPLATYFSGPKVKWIFDNVDGAREKPPRPETCSSATSTPGCCGTSPAAPTAVSTSPTSPTHRARCS